MFVKTNDLLTVVVLGNKMRSEALKHFVHKTCCYEGTLGYIMGGVVCTKSHPIPSHPVLSQKLHVRLLISVWSSLTKIGGSQKDGVFSKGRPAHVVGPRAGGGGSRETRRRHR